MKLIGKIASKKFLIDTIDGIVMGVDIDALADPNNHFVVVAIDGKDRKFDLVTTKGKSGFTVSLSALAMKALHHFIASKSINLSINLDDRVGFKFSMFNQAYEYAAQVVGLDEDQQQKQTFALETLVEMESDCARFIANNLENLNEVCSRSGYSDDQAGIDFFLTRNGHGAGFWDRGLGDVGDALSDAARAFGTCDMYVGDDGLIYQSSSKPVTSQTMGVS